MDKNCKTSKENNKQQEKEFYRNFYPITIYFPILTKDSNKNTEQINIRENHQKISKQAKIVTYITQRTQIEPTYAPTKHLESFNLSSISQPVWDSICSNRIF